MVRIHHIGKVVKNIKKELELYKKLGFEVEKKILIDKEQKARIGIVYSKGFVIELLEPLNKKSPIAKTKQGFHHICIEVDNLDAFLKYIKENNLGFPLTKKTTSVFNKKKVQFIATPEKDIIELIERRIKNE